VSGPGPEDAEDLLADLRTVLSVSRAMGAERDLDRLLALIVHAVTELVDAERTTLFLVDRQRGELWSRIAEGAQTIRIPIGRGIAGAVAASGVSVNIPSAYDDPRFDPANDQRSGFRTRSILCTPLTNHQGEVVGVIQALNQRAGRPFDARDEDLLESLGSQAAVAIENAWLIAAEAERQRLLADLDLARSIQQSLLPRSLPQVPGWRFAAWNRSCDQTGGDYHDLLPAADGAVDLVVGDVSGHGVGAALHMTAARAFLHALHEQGTPAGSLMRSLNRLIGRDMADDAFMTLAICRLAADGGLAFTAAGHEPPRILRRATGRWERWESTGPALAILPDPQFETVVVPPLDPGDLVLLLTDGIPEAAAPATSEWFGDARLEAAAASAAERGPEAVRDAVIAALDAWLAGTPQHDDQTLLIAERR
jgi:sigma-B regulation protein RsbU (phosphoserine phosphatase)